MRQKAQELGALTVAGSIEVTGIDVEDGRVRRVHTDQGDDRGRRRRHRLRRLEPADRERWPARRSRSRRRSTR